jgi:hypothetical protein
MTSVSKSIDLVFAEFPLGFASCVPRFVNNLTLTAVAVGQKNGTLERNEPRKLMGNPLIYVSIKCQVDAIFDSKYKTAVYEAMKKKVGAVMAKNASTHTLDKSKGTNPVQYELVVSLKMTKDDKSKPPRINANVVVKGTAFTTTGPKTFTITGGSYFEGPNPNKLDRDAAQATSDAVEEVMTKKVVPAMTP